MTVGNSQRRDNVPRSPEDFPCQKEKNLSMKCLENNDYDYGKCKHAFENFKFCIGFWDKVRKTRLRCDIEPAMPPPAEREEIFKLYKETGTIPDYSRRAT